MMTIPGTILHSLLLLLVPLALLMAGCGKEEYMRPDERWPDRPAVTMAADSALGEALHGMRMGIDNADSTLRLSVTFMAHDEAGTKRSLAGFGILLYGTTGDSDETFPPAVSPGDIAEGSPILLAGDPLVLLAPADSPLTPPVHLAALRPGMIAMVAPEQPEGRLAAMMIRRLGLGDTLAERMLVAGSGRDLIDMITSGRAAVGIINGSDARRFAGRTKIIDTLRFPPGASGTGEIPMIRYHALMLRNAPDSGAAARMMAWLVTTEFQRSFHHHGFIRRDSILATERRNEEKNDERR